MWCWKSLTAERAFRNRLLDAFAGRKKKPTRQNTLRCSIASAYLLTSFPACAGLLFIESSDAVERRRFASSLNPRRMLRHSCGIARGQLFFYESGNPCAVRHFGDASASAFRKRSSKGATIEANHRVCAPVSSSVCFRTPVAIILLPSEIGSMVILVCDRLFFPPLASARN